MWTDWDNTRNAYIDWLSKTKLRKIFAKEIKFKNFSLWWITNLMNKDNRNNPAWYIRLNNKLNGKSDNRFNNLNYFKLVLILFKKFISAIFSNILVKLILADNFQDKKTKDCFYSSIINLIDHKNFFLDRQYGLISIKDKIKKTYIVETPLGISLIKNIFKYKNNLKKTYVDYLVLNSKYNIKDIIYVYLKTLFLLFKTIKILNKSNFFLINKKNCSNILKEQLLISFFGNIQDQLLKSLALEKSLNIIKPKNFITYFCFYPEARMQYDAARRSKVKNILNVNHAIYQKQNIYWNFSKKEFSSNQSNFFSPKPDIFICKGVKEYKELKKFFINEKFYFAGCLKSDLRKVGIKKSSKNKKRKRKKVLTLLTAETDYQALTKILNQCDLRKYIIYVDPHPHFKKETLNYFQKNLTYNFKIRENLTKNKLYQISDFILFGDTQLGIELAIKNYNVIRLYEKSMIPQYDLNIEFPYACDGSKLQELLKVKKHKSRAKLLEKNYFFKYDFKASERFQIILDKL